MVVERAKTQGNRGLVALPAPPEVVVAERGLLERWDFGSRKHQDGTLLDERPLRQIDAREHAAAPRAGFADLDEPPCRDGLVHRKRLPRNGDVSTPQSEVGNGVPAASPTSAEGRRAGERRLAKTMSHTSVNPP